MSKRKLLLADDSVTIQKVVNLTFADEGIDVITVGDGDSAMNVISEQSPDVVLADVHMPGLSGYRICEIVRDNPATRDLPVVLLVGSFEPFDENEAQRVGANAYLTKPFQSIRQLVSQVTELMAASSPPAEEPVAEFVPAPETPDTTDIDSLYHRSFSDIHPEEAEAMPPQFMEPQPEESEETGPPRYVDAGMDDEMIETSYVEGEAQDSATGYVHEEAVEDVPATYATEEAYAAGATAEQGQAFEAAYTDTHAAASAAAGEPEPVDRFASPEETAVGDRTTEREFELDEIELLELPPIENGKTLEFTTTQSMRARGGGKQVVSLSPELMDIIVQKVVEKLSEKY